MPEYFQIAIRATATYVILFFLTRLMGKREISQLTFFDYIVGITIGSMSAILSLETQQSFWNILIAVVLWALFQIIISYADLKSKTLRNFTKGSPTVLVGDGRIIEANLAKEHINKDELTAMLREKNTFNIADVDYAILETNGKLSVMKKPNKQTITPADLHLTAEYTGLGILVVEEGEVNIDALRSRRLTRSWLMGKLAQQGIYDLSKIFLAQVDEAGNLYVDLYDQYEQQLKKSTADDMILAKLVKVHANLTMFSLDTEDRAAKNMYTDCEKRIQDVRLMFESYSANQTAKHSKLREQLLH